MLKKRGKIRVITSFPFWKPHKLHPFNRTNRLFMNIFKMESVSSIFWNILNMRIYCMNSLTSIFELFLITFNIQKIKCRLLIFIYMKPQIDEPMNLFNMVFSELYFFFFLLLPFNLCTTLLSHFILIFNTPNRARFFIII